MLEIFIRERVIDYLPIQLPRISLPPTGLNISPILYSVFELLFLEQRVPIINQCNNTIFFAQALIKYSSYRLWWLQRCCRHVLKVRFQFEIRMLILFLSRMEKDEWEGFEEFPDQYTQHVHQKINILYASHSGHQKQRPQSRSHPTEHVQSPLKKKIQFKPNTRRKISFAHGEESKKSPEKKSSEMMKSQSRRSSVYIQKPASKQRQGNLGQKEEQRIPIFRFPNMAQAGRLIYKGFMPIFASQYFSYEEEEQIRDTTQSTVGDAIRNSLRTIASEDELVFNSKFESGNLDLVRKLNNQYHLYLAPDTNTKGHRQWFYFTLFSHKHRKVKLIIHGFKKPHSLFQKGMSPYGKRLEEGVQSWKPIGSNIKYIRQEKRLRVLMKRLQYQYCLSFDLALESRVNYCIASSIPYSFTYLKSQLGLHRSPSFLESVLCKSLMGLEVPLLTFGPKNTLEPSFVILNARTHPGQSPSSWVAEGIIQFLAESQTAKAILQQCNVIIKVIPMLNPDGVYMGNYRTGIMGIDYNRLFLSGRPDIFPEVQALRKLVRQCKEVGKVDLFLDLHGHSINPGCFIYGPDPCFAPFSVLKNLTAHLRQSCYFAGKHCKAGADNTKSETARIYFQVNQGIYSLTCENSLGLMYSDSKCSSTRQFDAFGWKQFGRNLIETILVTYEESHSHKGFHRLQGSLTASACRIKWGNFDQFSYKKAKTDIEDIGKHIESLRSLHEEDIDLTNPGPDYSNAGESSNDSDNESENLSPEKQDELIGIVAKLIQQRQKISNSEILGTDDYPKRDDFRSRTRRTLKGQCLGNFKEYRFGYEDNALNEWLTKKRLLSIPKVLKTEKINQSYIIRKSMPKAYPNQLIFESIDKSCKKAGKQRLQTEPRDPEHKRGESRLSKYRTELQRQKFLLDMQLPRKI